MVCIYNCHYFCSVIMNSHAHCLHGVSFWPWTWFSHVKVNVSPLQSPMSAFFFQSVGHFGSKSPIQAVAFSLMFLANEGTRIMLISLKGNVMLLPESANRKPHFISVAKHLIEVFIYMFWQRWCERNVYISQSFGSVPNVYFVLSCYVNNVTYCRCERTHQLPYRTNSLVCPLLRWSASWKQSCN